MSMVPRLLLLLVSLILRLLQLNLEMEGHEVATAPDGRAGLEAIRAQRPTSSCST